MKVREDGESQTIDVTVCEYYQKKHQIEVSWSAKFPCLDVGKPNCPNYLPLEVTLVSLFFILDVTKCEYSMLLLAIFEFC